MLEDLGIKTDELVIVMIVFIFALIVMVLMLSSKVSRLTRIYKNYMTGANGKSLAEQFKENFGELDDIRGDLTEHKARIVRLEGDKNAGFCKFAIRKYDAFMGVSGKMSFSLCMLTAGNDGFVLTSVHNADGCYTYIKEIVKGKAKFQLSADEGKVLEEAKIYNDPVAEVMNNSRKKFK